MFVVSCVTYLFCVSLISVTEFEHKSSLLMYGPSRDGRTGSVILIEKDIKEWGQGEIRVAVANVPNLILLVESNIVSIQNRFSQWIV